MPELYTDISGILSIVFAFLFSPAGIVLGIVGIAQAKKHQASKILSLIGVVISSIFTVFTVLIVVGLVVTTKSGIEAKSRDMERQVDIKAIHGKLEAYYAQKGKYPTFAELNSASWVAQNLQGMDSESLIDPSGTQAVFVVTPTAGAYAYKVGPDYCDNITTVCTTYVLTATLESATINGERVYAKSALN